MDLGSKVRGPAQFFFDIFRPIKGTFEKKSGPSSPPPHWIRPCIVSDVYPQEYQSPILLCHGLRLLHVHNLMEGFREIQKGVKWGYDGTTHYHPKPTNEIDLL